MTTENKEGPKQPKPPMSRSRRTLISVFAVLFCIYELVVVSGFYTDLIGQVMEPVVFRSGHLFFILILVYLYFPLNLKRWKKLGKGIDIVLITLGAVSTGYWTVFYEAIFNKMQYSARLEWFQMVLGVSICVVSLEATGRALKSWIFPALVVLFWLHGHFGEFLPGLLHTSGYDLESSLFNQLFGSIGIWGSPLGASADLIYAFVLFSTFLGVTGASKAFLNLALALVGRVMGGPAKVSVVASALFGMLSGSAVANVATVGSITIPLMRKSGYPPYYAGAIEAASSTGGMIMPPVMAAGAFIIAEWLNLSYASVALAAAIPAVLYYASLFIQSHFQAVRLNLRGLSKEETPEIGRALLDSWYILIPLVVLIYLLAVPKWQAPVCCLVALVAVIILSMLRKETRLTPKKVLGGIESTASSMLAVGTACAAAGILVGSIHLTGLALKISGVLLELVGAHLLLLVIVAGVTCLILGFPLPPTAAYIFIVALLAPAMVKAGIVPLAAHLYAFYYSVIGVITPPLSVAAFTAAAMADAPVMKTSWQAMRLGIASYLVPLIFVFNPALILQGTPGQIVQWFLIAFAAIFMAAIAVEGYLLAPARMPERAAWGIGSGALILGTVFSFTWGLIGGAVFLVTGIILNKITQRLSKKRVMAVA